MHTFLSTLADLRTAARGLGRSRAKPRHDAHLAQSPATAPAPQDGSSQSDPGKPDPADVIHRSCCEFDGFRLIPSAEVAPEVGARLETQFKALPRPPRAFHEMLSLDFVARASSGYVGELVSGEPIIAARILARVNSSFYGARTPILQIGQAITFLGLQSVRNICLRYLLDESFKTADRGLRAALDKIGDASSLATELCHRFAKGMELDDASSLSTHVVLSFTGHLACALVASRNPETQSAQGETGLLQRFRRQQASIGLAAPEVGRLLLTSWNLPKALTDKVASIDHALLPLNGAPDRASESRAIGYLCARLGEQLARGRIMNREDLAAFIEADTDVFHLRSHFDPNAYAAVVRIMGSDEFLERVHGTGPEN